MINEITLKNEHLRVRILPDRGGKIASVYDRIKNFELLYQPGHGYPPLEPGMPFSEGDASGFDDVFPSMGERWSHSETGETETLPDHGEIWTSRMTVTEKTAETVRMYVSGTKFPWQYGKEVSLLADGLRQRITVKNQGKDPFPCLWICHCLMRMEPDMRFEFPRGAKAVECVPGCSWPPEGEEKDTLAALRIPPPEGTMMKFYFRHPVSAGECAAVYPRSGVRAVLRFDPNRLPYLGFWITNGGYRGEYNFAFEPASGYYDTLGKASETGTLPVLKPGEHFSFEMSVLLR